jgi:hypothetical protein
MATCRNPVIGERVAVKAGTVDPVRVARMVSTMDVLTEMPKTGPRIPI